MHISYYDCAQDNIHEQHCSEPSQTENSEMEESEMIAHLQSLFWSSSDFHPDFCYSNNSSSVNNSETCDGSYDCQVDTLVSANEMNIGVKRKLHMDEEMGHGDELRATPSAPRKNGNKSRTAMDSQSHYAKKRRQRINERLRILQQLIPNGTKVDISTMLEEAVHYVKFMHLQIKLLSSDEMWMYAPLAYDGVNVRLPHLYFLAQE